MNKTIIFLLIAIGLAFYLLSPGVWWGDSLNCYIQGIHGMYGSAQPVFFAFLFNLTRHIIPGSLPVFSMCVLFYFTGFYLMVFGQVKHRLPAALLFFAFSFCPLLFANVGVIQTETLQLSSLALFMPLAFLLYRYQGRWRKIFFLAVCLPFSVFALVRYDALPLTLLLSYWLSYSFFRKHSIRTVILSLALLLSFFLTGSFLKSRARADDVIDSEMQNSLMVSDLAAISAESNINYVPDYCWQGYLPANERTVERIQFGLKEWKASFYSYIYNIQPAIGLFTYHIHQYESDLRKRWIRIVLLHPIYYLEYHLNIFGYLLDNDNFNMGLWSGLKESHINHARLEINRTPQVDSFLQAHKDRFAWQEGYLLLIKDDEMITGPEETELTKLVEGRRYSEVSWMKWYSQIPGSTYMVRNARAERYVQPFLNWYKQKFKWLSCLLPFAAALFVLLVFFSRKVHDPYLRFSFIMLCLCGLVHLAVRALILTDPVFRFGMLSILFTLYSVIILIADKTNPKDLWAPK